MAKLDTYSSALDVLQSIASSVPIGKPVGGVNMAMDIKKLVIENDNVQIEGRVSNQAQIASVRDALTKIALPKSLTTGTPASPKPGGVPFSFAFKVKRL